MTPSKQAKSYGLKTLIEAARIANIKVDTLSKWHKSRPELFKAVCLGCLVIKEREE